MIHVATCCFCASRVACFAQADAPFPDENLLPPPEEESEHESRLGSDMEEGGGEVGSEGDDGEDLLENAAG